MNHKNLEGNIKFWWFFYLNRDPRICFVALLLEQPYFCINIIFRVNVPFPWGRGYGTGYFLPRVAKPRVVGNMISPQVTKGTSQFPTHGVAGVMEDWFLPREAKPRVVGINLPSQLLSHKWGIGMCLEWQVGNSPSLPLLLKGLTLYHRWVKT